MEIDDIDRGDNIIKENPKPNITGLKGNTTNKTFEKHSDKTSESIDGKYDTKRPGNQINNYTNTNNQAKFCPNCGTRTKPNYKFCKNCGHLLLAFKKIVKQTKKENNNYPISNDSKTKSSLKVSKIPNNNNNNNKSIKNSVEIATQNNTNPTIKPTKTTQPNNTNQTIKPTKTTQANNANRNIKNENKENITPLDKNTNGESVVIYSIADEIYKFYELKEKGIISSEEFEKKKKQLLEA